MLYSLLLLLFSPSISLASPLLASRTSSQAGNWSWASTDFVFSFGDSYTESGFNISNGILSVDPGTADRGPPWITALTSRYNISPSLKLFNFAFSGGTIDEDLVVPYATNVQSFRNQASTFERYFCPAPAEAAWSSDNTLFTVFIGINDIDRSWDWTNTSLPSFYQAEADRYHTLLTHLSTLGARNFLLLSVPPIDLTPKYIALGSSYQKGVRKAVKTYNEKLADMAREFGEEMEKEGGWVGLFDTGKVFDTILNNPDTFGYVNITGFADQSLGYNNIRNDLNLQVEPYYPASDYFWGNDFHPTWPVHDTLAHAVSTFLAAKD